MKPEGYPRAFKGLGQNFLIDKNVIDKMVSLVPEAYRACAIEIGTGTGSLTRALSKRFQRVITVELDKRLIEWHKGKEILPENCLLVEGDILGLSFKELILLLGFKEAVLCGNLPYNISSQVVFKLCEEREVIPFALLMFQREVAKRIVACPGTKEYGIISVISQYFFHVDMLLTLSPNVFRPRPRVFSSVVSFKRRKSEEKKEIALDHDLFLKIVKASFSKRRKKLKNSLAYFIKDKERLVEVLEKADIQPGKRAEELGVWDFVVLSNVIKRYLSSH